MHTIHEKEVDEHTKKYKIDFSEKGLEKECKKNNIQHILSFGCGMDRPTPMGLDIIKKQQKNNNRIKAVIGINTNLKITKQEIKQVEDALRIGIAKAIKIYLGYTYFYAYDKVYTPFYKLAEKYNCPVIFHTGDTFGEKALLKYAHPLTIDEVAVKFPKVNFVIAHLGNPWIIDAAEVIYKNPNVYADLSGFAIGKVDKAYEREITKKIRYALNYVGDPKKFVYGSDWPLISMTSYIKMMKKIIPFKLHKDIFYNNALELFNLK